MPLNSGLSKRVISHRRYIWLYRVGQLLQKAVFCCRWVCCPGISCHGYYCMPLYCSSRWHIDKWIMVSAQNIRSIMSMSLEGVGEDLWSGSLAAVPFLPAFLVSDQAVHQGFFGKLPWSFALAYVWSFLIQNLIRQSHIEYMFDIVGVTDLCVTYLLCGTSSQGFYTSICLQHFESPISFQYTPPLERQLSR